MHPRSGGLKRRTDGPFATRTKRWAIVLGLCTLLGVLEAAQAHLGMAALGRTLGWGPALMRTLPSWYVLALLLPLVFRVADRFRFEPGRSRRAFAVHLVAALLFPLFHLGLTSLVSAPLLGEAMAPARLMATAAGLATIYFVVDVFFYAALVGGYYAVDFYRKFQERALVASQFELKASRLETSLAQANLQTLKSQLQPHFLFNTLNAISVLALKGEKEAVVRMLGRLSDLLRATLENPAQTVTLEEELKFLDRYLGIEQVRFHDRLTVETSVTPESLEAQVPALLLQPLVENAIRHGIAQTVGPARIEIRARRDNGSLELEVRDTGAGLDAKGSPGGTGVGLSNTRARLEQLYGNDFRFELANAEGGGAVARIAIPFRPQEPTS